MSVCAGRSSDCPVKLLVSSITKSLLQIPPSALKNKTRKSEALQHNSILSQIGSQKFLGSKTDHELLTLFCHGNYTMAFVSLLLTMVCMWHHWNFILEATHSTKLIHLYFLEFDELSLHAKVLVDTTLLSGVTNFWISWQQNRESNFWRTKINACVWI